MNVSNVGTFCLNDYKHRFKYSRTIGNKTQGISRNNSGKILVIGAILCIDLVEVSGRRGQGQMRKINWEWLAYEKRQGR